MFIRGKWHASMSQTPIKLDKIRKYMTPFQAAIQLRTVYYHYTLLYQ